MNSSIQLCPHSYSVQNLALMLETNKYKLIMKIPIDDVEIVKSKCQNECSSIGNSTTAV